LKPQKSAPSVRFVPTAIGLPGALALNADHRTEEGCGEHADHHTRELLRIR
jgi:hypothetical protein